MSIHALLEHIKQNAKSPKEQGTAFENLCKRFLEKDKTYSPRFKQVQTYTNWAKAQQILRRDIGIDLVATNSNDSGFTAIQCKFYDANSPISKGGIDSFIAASAGQKFNARIFFDTTNKGPNNNVLAQLNQAQDLDFTRIGIEALEHSSIDWSQYLSQPTIQQKPKKQLRPHQSAALKAVTQGLAHEDRGKLIMACGTGKTFTALKIAEQLAGNNRSVLFLAPSLALVSQTITEWTIESDADLHAFAVCSDAQVGKRKVGQDDLVDIDTHDLAYPATTNARTLAQKCAHNSTDNMQVVFATYQSIDVISKAQQQHGLPEFDLIICDEAHKTTGVSIPGQEDSHFVKVHDQGFIKGHKRLYMTATPRVYVTQVKKQADKTGAILHSMDDAEKFGKELYTLGFGDAVQQDLLSDYKVLVLAVDEGEIARDIQSAIADSDRTLKLDDASKIVGCYKALLKIGVEQTEGKQPMRRAVAFCRSIKESELFRDAFDQVIKKGYLKTQDQYSQDQLLDCEIKHLDGTMNTAVRNAGISWLKHDHNDDTCRILTNVRCLSEGVDVPSLDAVLFVHSRKSKVDIVQSVGRVMRKAEGKQLGYVILPIVVSAGVLPEEALNNNKNYEIVWDVLNALRSHDERLDAEINRVEFGGLTNRIEVVSEISDMPQSGTGTGKTTEAPGVGGAGTAAEPEDRQQNQQYELTLHSSYDSVQRAILAKIVNKCGTRTYWADWAVNVADIAQKHITRINGILAHTDSEAYRAFQAFLHELQKNINASVTAEEVVEMLAQHMITQPVFEALFADYDFNANNPVSQAIQKVLDVLNKHHIDSEAEKLQGFYASVKARVAGIDNDRGKQKIIVELYDKFFRSAFPRLTDRLGIVYTPVECVDFIIHSVNDVLQQEFGQTLADEHTHIIDPFAGTGTFITRIIQSGLIDKARLAHKYQHELHANEIVLLAYYLASINIESAYHAAMLPAHDAATGPDQHAYLQAADASGVYQQAYQPFEGICLTDTFQLYEQDEHLLTPQLPVNSKRLNRQKKLDIKVILGNPPYSAGQKSGNDNNQNLSYPNLDTSIEDSYAKHSQSSNLNSLYDSYIRAMRWASDRIGVAGVIGFITNAGWIESNAADGMRKTLKEEFSSIYIFHLRGNQRTSGELSRKEGGKIFGGGSRAPIAISILVKNPQASSQGAIYFCDIGDYLSRDDKLKTISQYQSIQGISETHGWQRIEPDKYHDWLNQRDDSFYEHIPIGAKKTNKPAIFENYSRGLETGRDAWVYNASQSALEGNIKRTIAFYNQELQRYQRLDKTIPVKDFINYDSTKIAWSEDNRDTLRRHLPKSFHHTYSSIALYRPFTQMHCYYSKEMTLRTGQMPRIFPEAGLDNLIIGVSGKGANSFSALMSNQLIDLHLLESGTQCFPLKLYERVESSKQKPATLPGLLDSASGVHEVAAASGERYWLRDGITNAGLKHFADYYPQQQISKEDVFYYIYGLLHSEDYRSRFAANLTKALPHIPRVKSYAHFAAFAQAGRQLADLHLNYEHKQPYPVDSEPGKLGLEMMSGEEFYVQKMRFKSKKDKSTIVYNDNITIKGIPSEAYDYLVNGRSAIEWVMERQRISTHKDSGIVNSPNDWAVETMNNPRYPFDLLLKVIGISVDSVRIIKALPELSL